MAPLAEKIVCEDRAAAAAALLKPGIARENNDDDEIILRKRSATWPGNTLRREKTTKTSPPPPPPPPSLSSSNNFSTFVNIDKWLHNNVDSSSFDFDGSGWLGRIGDTLDIDNSGENAKSFPRSPLAICCFINHILCDRDNHMQFNLKPFLLKFISPTSLCLITFIINLVFIIYFVYQSSVLRAAA